MTMIEQGIRDKVREYGLAGKSQREISRQLEISRGSVGIILRGGQAHDPVHREKLMPFARCDKHKCPTCGASIVLLPCVRCTFISRREPWTPNSKVDET